MKNKLIISALLSIFIITPALASSHGNSGHTSERQDMENRHEKENDEQVVPTVTVPAGPSITSVPLDVVATPSPTCDKDADWKNHGQFVSCVARHHGNEDEDGGSEDVSEAARSDIGKEHRGSPSVTPTSALLPSLTLTPTGTSEVTVTVTPTGTEEAISGAADHVNRSSLQSFLTALENLREFLKSFIR